MNKYTNLLNGNNADFVAALDADIEETKANLAKEPEKTDLWRAVHTFEAVWLKGDDLLSFCENNL